MKKKEFLRTFEEELFVPDFEAETKVEVLEAIVEFLHSQKRINNRDAVLNTLLAREGLGSTGLGKGVAVPHSRSTMVDRLTVVFGRFNQGIDFEARDGKPVYLVFMILAPPQDVGNQYLPFLGKLVEVLKEKPNRDKLKKVKTFEEFMSVMEAVA